MEIIIKKINKYFREWILPIGLAFVIALVFRANIAEAMYIPSSSMEPTLKPGDIVVIEKISRGIERGDVVVFKTPKLHNGEEYIIKRVIGLPGETLQVKNGRLLINGDKVQESYNKNSFKDNFGPITLAQESYFVMGDNRNNSVDSRNIGAISLEQINGRYIFRIPISKLNP
ncbi:signal peptidase I [Proteinivorax tanatarense]|uniref:Signal peptidase I n=1 Tax=Proteinivorax tanatarense TaxID=1260629 RepID=A0AAU7VMH6_9FIRM